MNILTLANGPLDPSRGSGYVICGYSERLGRRGHRVTLLEPRDFEPGYGLTRAIRWRQAFGMARACLSAVASERFDVIEIFGGEAWLAFSLLARITPRPALLVSRSNGLETHALEVLRGGRARGRLEGAAARAYERAFRRADLLVLVSEFDRAFARSRRYQREDRLLVLPNPLPDAFLGLDVDLAREPLLGFVGSWLPIKGTDLLASDVPSLLAEFPRSRLLLIGVGARFDPAKHFPAALLSRIEVVAEADRERELPALYRRLALLLAPSRYESFSLVAAEAMAHGCPVVASPVGFPAGLAPGEEVVLLEDRAPGSLYAAARPLLADEAYRHRVAAGGHARVQALSWDQAVARLESAYARLLPAGAEERP